MRAAAGVGPIVVVVTEILGQIAAEGREAGDQGAGEGGAVALLEDGLVDALDAAVALGAPGADTRVAMVPDGLPQATCGEVGVW